MTLQSDPDSAVEAYPEDQMISAESSPGHASLESPLVIVTPNDVEHEKQDKTGLVTPPLEITA